MPIIMLTAKSSEEERVAGFALGYQFEGYERSIDAHIKNIRQKIEEICKRRDRFRGVCKEEKRFRVLTAQLL